MSLDYPNRSVWLARRDTNPKPSKRRGRLIWNSVAAGTYVYKKHGPIGRDFEDLHRAR